MRMIEIAENIQMWIVLGVTVLTVVLLYLDKFHPTLIFFASILVLIIFGIVKIETFLESISNKQVVTIFLLIFIAVSVRAHGNTQFIFDKLFGQLKSGRWFLLKMMFTVAFFSSFLNNTPIVAMLISNVREWALNHKMAPSKFLIPLSYSAILGGVITVIGTSTNLVLNGLLNTNGEPTLGILDFMPLGLMVTVSGIIYLVTIGYGILPNHPVASKTFMQNIREYILESRITKDSPLIGKLVKEAGLKNLKGIYLVEISRNNKIYTPVGPNLRLEAGDLLYFAGDTDTIIDKLRKFEGLQLTHNKEMDLENKSEVIEAVVPANSRLAGIRVKDSNFRLNYDSSIVGVHRNGEHLTGKIGDLFLKSGDLLLVLAGDQFRNKIAQNKNLYVISEREGSLKGNPTNKMAYYILQVIVALLTLFGICSFFFGLTLSFFLLMSFGFLNIEQIMKNFNFNLLIILACSITLGSAFISSGAADFISQKFIEMSHGIGTVGLLSSLFIFTVVLTTLITNVAAVSIAFPIAYTFSRLLDVSGEPLYLACAFGASAAFLTPISYQTNLMIYGPGGYNSRDFFKVGLPLTIIYGLVCILYLSWKYNL